MSGWVSGQLTDGWWIVAQPVYCDQLLDGILVDAATSQVDSCNNLITHHKGKQSQYRKAFRQAMPAKELYAEG